MQSCTDCPVVRAIGEIYGAGYSDTNDQAIIKVGGYEMVLDEMSFYIASRKLTLARFELRKPSDTEIARFYESQFAKFSSVTYRTIFMAIYPRNNYLYDKFTALVDLLGKTEDILQSYVLMTANPNVSIPSLYLLPMVDRVILYNGTALTQTMNKIIDFVNKLSIGQKKEILDPVDEFTSTIDMELKTPEGTPSLRSIHELLKHELIVASYARELEKYQVYVINYMEKINQTCERLIDMMMAAHVDAKM